MNTELISGIGLIAFGAFASSSFAMAFSKTRGWAWENNWLVYSLFAYIIVPLISCFIFCPGFGNTLVNMPVGELALVFGLGIIYGICNLTFGLSLRYLGLSLGFALSLGLMMILGTILPPAIDGRLHALFAQSKGGMLIAGLVIALAGIALSAYSGALKDKASGSEANKDFNFKTGILMVLFVGITGVSQALGIEQGNVIANEMTRTGIDPLFASLPIFIVLYGGSFIITLIWCLVLAKKSNKLDAFVSVPEGGILKNYAFCGLAGFLWFINYIFYGMGRSHMGEFSFTAWGILMSLSIVFATLWGFYRGEWKSTSANTRVCMFAGLIVLVVAAFVIGMSSN